MGSSIPLGRKSEKASHTKLVDAHHFQKFINYCLKLPELGNRVTNERFAAYGFMERCLYLDHTVQELLAMSREESRAKAGPGGAP